MYLWTDEYKFTRTEMKISTSYMDGYSRIMLLGTLYDLMSTRRAIS
jgi:hypothetical protein